MKREKRKDKVNEIFNEKNRIKRRKFYKIK